MGGDTSVLSPSVAPLSAASGERPGHLSNFDSSVNAVSFGFVATAVLILMFLIMAVFERFLRPRSSVAAGRNPRDFEAQMMFHGKLDYASPKMTIYAKGVSVLMPGEEIPTFIAHPAPASTSISQPLHQCSTFSGTSSSTSTR